MFKNMIFSVLLAILLTWFALTNAQQVTVTVLFRSYQFSLSLVILICVLIGVIISGLTAVMEESRLLKKIKDLEAKVKHDESLLMPQGEKKE